MTKEELFEIAEKKHDIRISYYIDEGFKIFKKNIGGFIGITVITFLISFGIGKIPYIGGIISEVLTSFIYGGIILVCAKIRRGEEDQFNDFFEVFKNPGQFILLLIVKSLMIVMVAIPAIAVFFLRYYDVFLNGKFPSSEAALAMVPLMFLVLIPVMFLSMCYIFSTYIYLCINQDFWTAMEASRKVVMKNWLSILGFLIVLLLLTIVVVLFTCGIGILVMYTFIAAAVYVAFDDIFKPTANTFENKIDAFGSVHKDLNTEAEEKNI
jgi:hypothetical protein